MYTMYIPYLTWRQFSRNQELASFFYMCKDFLHSSLSSGGFQPIWQHLFFFFCHNLNVSRLRLTTLHHYLLPCLAHAAWTGRKRISQAYLRATTQHLGEINILLYSTDYKQRCSLKIGVLKIMLFTILFGGALQFLKAIYSFFLILIVSV